MTTSMRSIVVGAGVGIALAFGSAMAGNTLVPDTGFSSGDMDAISARVAKATQIASAIRQASPMDDSQFVGLSQALLGATDAGLEAAAGATSLKGALAAIRGARMQKALGSGVTDFVFKPIVPCRLLDTRANGIKLVASTPFGVDFDGGNPGNAAGCTFAGVAAQTGTIGTGRAALAINLTVTEPAGPGFIQARPVGTTNVTSNQNFVAGQDVAAYAVIQDAGTAAEFELFASVPTHAVVDVLGVFAPAGATALECNNQESASTPIANNTTFAVSSPACPAGFSPTGPTFRNTSTFSVNFVINNMFPNGTAYTCQGQNVTGATVNFQCGVRCCRVPGA
jgi:hypothetical protein